MKRRVRTTCPRDCYDGCGIVVELDGERIDRVLGDPDHPVSRGKLCGKCALAYNGVWRDPDARLQRPLRRTGSKGEGRFAPVSWDEALEEIAGRLGDIVTRHGGERVLHAHYTGTCSLLAGEFPMRFFNRLGATEVEPDTICNNAGHAALTYVYGTSVDGFDPKTIRDTRCLLIWGANPSASAPHAHEHWLDEAAGHVIVIDPVRHASAEKADIHVQPFPGSDAALAFGLMHAIHRAGRVDEAFLEAHTLGWDELEPLVENATPEWTAEVTGVPATTIEEVARRYTQGPSLLWLGQGLQRQPHGGNVMRACAALPAITGNLGKPGAGLCYLNGDGPRNIDADIVGAPHLRRAPASSIGHMDLADALADPQRTRAFFCWNMNVAASAPRQRALRGALAREDLFSVVVELFQTDTADFADIVLPAASFLEFDDLVVPYFHLLLSAQAKAMDPPGEALPNQEIFRRLARAMGYAERELYTSDREILDELLAGSGLGVDFDALARSGTIDPFPEPVVTFADLEFPTSSGRIELASASAEADGHPRVPQPHADSKPPQGTLRLLSPASRWLMNDSYANDPQVRRALGAPRVTVHPEDARALGLVDGELVRLSNETGEIALRLSVSDAVAPGVALAHKGHWPKLEDAGVNVNALNPGVRSDMGESTSVHGTLVQIAPA
jgi:anaerobic selenocysteine-containing dehydrogenase